MKNNSPSSDIQNIIKKLNVFIEIIDEKSNLKLFKVNSNDNDEMQCFKTEILQIFTFLFSKSYNHLSFSFLSKMLNNFLLEERNLSNNNNILSIIKDEKVLKNFLKLSSVAIANYDEYHSDKDNFKFVDLLDDNNNSNNNNLNSKYKKDSKKSLKEIKSEVRSVILTLLKCVLSKINPINNNSNNIIIDIISVEDKHNKYVLDSMVQLLQEMIPIFSHENEKNRILFSEFFHIFLLKYNLLIKKSENLSSISNNNIHLLIIKLTENYFNEEIYDSIIEVRKNALLILNLMMSNFFERSKYFDNFKECYRESKKNKIAVLQALAYLEEEKEKISKHFENFNLILNSIVNLLIDEEDLFGINCKKFLEISLNKFPIFLFNEYLKAQTKNQLNRLNLYHKIFKKVFDS